ncbi:MAG: YjbQ family protein [Deltaproteobacteria bacterium]|nr:YjbQ family protein [Deltaproteobacteria bacterium]
MKIFQESLQIQTRGRGLVDLSADVQRVVDTSTVTTGVCLVFVAHTSASLLIQENADPTVRSDLIEWLDDLAPEGRKWRHDAEGPDDMPAHAKSTVTRTSESIPVTAGKLALGTWQALYLFEHRDRPHVRKIVIHVTGI